MPADHDVDEGGFMTKDYGIVRKNKTAQSPKSSVKIWASFYQIYPHVGLVTVVRGDDLGFLSSS